MYEFLRSNNLCGENGFWYSFLIKMWISQEVIYHKCTSGQLPTVFITFWLFCYLQTAKQSKSDDKSGQLARGAFIIHTLVAIFIFMHFCFYKIPSTFFLAFLVSQLRTLWKSPKWWADYARAREQIAIAKPQSSKFEVSFFFILIITSRVNKGVG